MKQLLNQDWLFKKENIVLAEDALSVNFPLERDNWERVNLPHTWNGIDGQDGGNDYERRACCYAKILKTAELPCEAVTYLEFEGANSSAVLFVNGKKAGAHDGGYSTWRANISSFLNHEMEEQEIVVYVNNAANNYVYPQMADFTFYGGLYRNVSLIGASDVRFDLDYYGGPGIKVTPKVEGNTANVEVEVFVSAATGEETIHYTIYDGKEVIAQKESQTSLTKTTLTIENVHLWQGRKDPFLYTLTVELKSGTTLLDSRSIRFGCRSFEIHPEKGFILNGTQYPLRGVSRHQDYPVIGNALLKEHHERDIDLICEMGATTIRLAHYQHNQYFYDLCDERGLVIWAEIPYISLHMPTGRENTISQMKELIVQNYNHPSIVVWGLSNEITMKSASDPDLIENHRILNDLVHEMDATRLSTMAVVSMCPIDEEYVRIPDVVSYNHYFGWYGGDTSMNGPWFDDFHEKYPNIPIGMSEYGCEALDWHSSSPEQGDYTEEYQAYYHEELIKQLFSRPYIWATHVWNMFDFAADARAEGGEDGMNHKGLVSFDRSYKKDSFYAYKAWLSDEPFVHICGKRYIDRVEDVTKITVYSNLPEVELFANGVSLGKCSSLEHFFYFEVPNKGNTTIIARAGYCSDQSRINKVEVFNEAYRVTDIIDGEVLNWFEVTAPEGYFSINDKVADIMSNSAGNKFFNSIIAEMIANSTGEIDLSEIGDAFMTMLNGFSVKRLISMIGTMGSDKQMTKADILKLNVALNQIKK